MKALIILVLCFAVCNSYYVGKVGQNAQYHSPKELSSIEYTYKGVGKLSDQLSLHVLPYTKLVDNLELLRESYTRAEEMRLEKEKQKQKQKENQTKMWKQPISTNKS